MRLFRLSVVRLVLVAAVCAAAGCEDNDPIAPKDASLVLTATPATVIIDTAAGESSASSAIEVLAFNSLGFPLSGVVVTLSTTGGTLLSNDNSCVSSRCLTTGEACSVSADCPALPPAGPETDDNGRVTDTLTLGLQDPASVTVTARSGTLSQTATVTKTVSSGNTPPTAQIALTPAARQEIQGPVTFDGRGSSDPDGSITCYQWTITSSVGASDEVVQSQTLAQFVRRYDAEQVLSVLLRVSDSAEAAAFCVPYEGPPGSSVIAPATRFSASVDSETYEIVCDLTPPTADGGADRNLQLASGTASVTLTGTGSDPDSAIAEFRWSCGNSQPDIFNLTAVCTYTFAGTFNARLTVTNECGLSASDEVKITVAAGP